MDFVADGLEAIADEIGARSGEVEYLKVDAGGAGHVAASIGEPL